MEKKKKRDNRRAGKKLTDETRQKISKSMLGNLNAEQYTLEDSLDLFGQMIIMSQDDNYTFIKQITRQFGVTENVIKHLVKRFQTLKEPYDLIKENLETNCYTATNDGKLKLPLAMLNLKSNYGWTDRVESKTDVTTQGQPLQMNNLITFVTGDNEDEETEK